MSRLNSKTTWAVIAALGVLVAVVGVDSLDAQSGSSWPKPADGWWKGLKPKAKAQYSMTMGPVECKLVIRVDKVKGSKVTYTSEAKHGESALRAPETKTVDCKNDPVGAGASLPLGANYRKVGSEALTVGGSTFNCDIFELVMEGKHMKVWHTRQIPPIFNQGNVRVETQGATILMTSYNGPKLRAK